MASVIARVTSAGARAPLGRLLTAPLGLDVWEVRPDHLVVEADEAQVARLEVMGYDVEQLQMTDSYLSDFATARATTGYHTVQTLEEDLRRLALDHPGPFSIRIPRDVVAALPQPVAGIPAVAYGTWETLRQGRDVAILALGTMVPPALAAAELLQREGVSATVVDCRFAKPLDEATLERLFPGHPQVLTVEEGTVVNGFGAFVRAYVAERWPGVRGASMGLPDAFVEHGERGELLAGLGLNADGIAARARALLGRPLRTLLETA